MTKKIARRTSAAKPKKSTAPAKPDAFEQAMAAPVIPPIPASVFDASFPAAILDNLARLEGDLGDLASRIVTGGLPTEEASYLASAFQWCRQIRLDVITKRHDSIDSVIHTPRLGALAIGLPGVEVAK